MCPRSVPRTTSRNVPFRAPQLVEQLVDVVKILDISSPVEQIIDVPKISSQDNIPQRAVPCAAAGGTVGGRAGGVPCGGRRYWHGLATLPTIGCPRSRGDGGLLVDVGQTTRPVDPLLPGGTHRQPRAVYKNWARLRWCAPWTSVVDVAVIIQLKFQQFWPIANVEAPQSQFTDRVLDIQDGTVQKTGDSTGAVLG